MLYCNAETYVYGFKDGSTLPSVPQVVHTDFDDSVIDGAKHKPFIVFALASSEGCMLLVWTKDLYVANNQEYFHHFYIYIPYGSIVFLPRGVREPRNSIFSS